MTFIVHLKTNSVRRVDFDRVNCEQFEDVRECRNGTVLVDKVVREYSGCGAKTGIIFNKVLKICLFFTIKLDGLVQCKDFQQITYCIIFL